MRSLSNVGLGLSIVFGFLLLALVAELYYLLWWKKRFNNSREIEEKPRSPAKELLYMFCWKKPSSMSSTAALNPQDLSSSLRATGAHLHDPEDAGNHHHAHPDKDEWLLKPFEDEDTMEAELMRLHHLPGPPRFLFPIIEETKEDLESEDGKSRGDGTKSRKGSRGRSLSDLIITLETPFLTPLASPPYFTPPLTPMDSSFNSHGFNPLFESALGREMVAIRSSPPPRFKFLKDAEEKLQRKKLAQEAEQKRVHDLCATSKLSKNEEGGSLITLAIAKIKEIELNSHPHHPPQHFTNSSQVLPLTSLLQQ